MGELPIPGPIQSQSWLRTVLCPRQQHLALGCVCGERPPRPLRGWEYLG